MLGGLFEMSLHELSICGGVLVGVVRWRGVGGYCKREVGHRLLDSLLFILNLVPSRPRALVDAPA